jgi:hypothetical protein
MLDELRKLPTCLTNFSAEERKLVLDALIVQRVNQGRERCIEEAKTKARREGKQLTEEEETRIRKSLDEHEARIRKSYDAWMAKGCAPRGAVRLGTSGPPRPSREQMHQELLKAGWTFEGLRRVRHTGAISEIAGTPRYSEHPFYSSPHKKLGALPQELAYQKMKRWEAGKKFGREQFMEERAEALYRAHSPRERKQLPPKYPEKWPVTMACTCGKEITVDRSGVEYAWEIHRICVALEERDTEL